MNNETRKKIVYLVMIVIFLFIIVVILQPATFPTYDDGIIGDKIIKNHEFLNYRWSTYYFKLDIGHRAERIKEVPENIYITMREGYNYVYYTGNVLPNCTVNIKYWWE